MPIDPTPRRLIQPVITSTPQARFVSSRAGFVGFCGGRGAGKSYAGALKLLVTAKPGRFYGVGVPGLKELLDGPYRMLRDVGGRLGYVRPGEINQQGCTLRLPDGTAEVTFRTLRFPDRLRGPNMSGWWLDEASYLPEESIDVVDLTLREGGTAGQMWCTFTAAGRRNWTYRRFVEQSQGELILAPSASNPHMPIELIERARARQSALRAAQELDAAFVDSEGQLIPDEHIIACMDDVEWPAGTVPARCGRLYVGVDIGRSRDQTCVWAWEAGTDGVLRARMVQAMRAPFAEQRRLIWRIAAHPCTVAVRIDRGTIGAEIAEDAERSFPGVAEGVSMSPLMQGEIAEYLAIGFAQRLVRVPNVADLRDDFALVGQPDVRSGKSYMPADRVGRDETGHADRFMAAALGYHAWRTKPTPDPTGHVVARRHRATITTRRTR